MKRFATVWLDGCSGCHMSFLDSDERLIELAKNIDVVFSPYVDIKEFPENVDIAIVEGSVSSEEDLEKIKKIRANTKTLIAFGDCAITGNISAMRNLYGVESVMRRCYIEEYDSDKIPTEEIPALLERVLPIHEVVKVDFFIQGCPPPADAIVYALSELLEGRVPNLDELTRFGK
jgi:NAD-reducing hydrogenase small subunit